jgi:long-chain acyl-CoA synthetase
MTCAMNAAFAAGATLALMARFDPANAIETIRRDRVSVFEGVPTMYSALLGVADRFPPEATATLRTCVSGGAALPVQVLSDFEKAFNAMILEGYGLTETSPGRVAQSSRRRASARLDRHADRRCPGAPCRRQRR